MDEIAHLDDAALESLREMLERPSEEDRVAERKFQKLYLDQVKLEQQTRKLQEAKERLEELQAHYAGLRDFIPVACVTLDTWGAIRDINLEGAKLLESEQSALIGKPLLGFVEHESRPVLLSFLRDLLENDDLLTAIFSITGAGGQISFVRARGRTDPASGLRFVALVDVTTPPPAQ